MKALILAGGKNRRFGSPKGLIDWNGRPLIQHIMNCLTMFFNDILIISDMNHYDFMNLPVVPDRVPGLGPLGGIYTGLKELPDEAVFAAPVDMPFLSESLIEGLINERKSEDVTVYTHKNLIEPLPGIYGPGCIETIDSMVERNRLGLHDLFRRVNAKFVPFSGDSGFFQNINSLQDLIRADSFQREIDPGTSVFS